MFTQEIICRATKHEFNHVLRNSKIFETAQNVSNFLNCFWGEKEKDQKDELLGPEQNRRPRSTSEKKNSKVDA